MREVINFDKGWLFHRGDIGAGEDFPAYKGIAYMGAKTERMLTGPASRFYNDNPDCYSQSVEYKREKWQYVDLPHDYIAGDVPDEKYNPALGFFRYDNAWYRKKFTLPKEDAGKRITLLFEGVATHATVYLNGCLIKHNFCGYTTFEADITDYVQTEGQNVLAVYVDASSHEGWWYEGAGIYRHVYLIKTQPLAVDLWGIYVRPRLVGNGKWDVNTSVTIRNDYYSDKNVRIVGEIIDENGTCIATGAATGKIKSRTKKDLKLFHEAADPALWSPDSPRQYAMRVKVYSGRRLTDENQVRFGFRYFEMNADKGLFINGKHYEIKGVCGHADCGLTGKAVPDNIHRYKVSLLKEMGANGYRTSHYPQAEVLMDALDENGFIVMDETRWFESTEEGKAQLEMLVKRDRNRPGVFFWSIGNEEKYFATEAGRKIYKDLAAFVKTLDDTRPVTAACDVPANSSIFDDADVIGINYNWDKIDAVREKYPGKAFLSTECCACGTTRGWYFGADDKKAFLPAEDTDTSEYFLNRERTWKFIASRPWMMGGYQWIAFEHRGEAIWPRLCSQSGAIDLYLQKKDAFYQNQSHWTEKPMVHLLPHWNFKGMEGVPIKVTAYTNCDRVELFVNGASAGVRNVEKYGRGEWEVPYAVGCIEAIAYKDGAAVAADRRETTGTPKALKLTLDTPDIKPNGEDIAVFSCYCVDEEGREVPDACAEVTFSASGSGTVFSTGSDVSDHTSLYLPVRRMRAGRITVAVKMKDVNRPLKLVAYSQGLLSAAFIKEF